ncbi:MAG: hypothetical protein CM15mP83_7190 [Flavobacteriaceae bacterium]|nr:MAG: hypothetical protein CM15mP83_7190 [Flavobacteriaceae bacterium]
MTHSVRWSYKTFYLACCKYIYSSLVSRLYSPMWCRALSPNHWKKSAIKSPKQPWINPTKNRFEPPGKELSKLINAYNDMVDQLAESAVQLAKSEREQAWREMAKQVAHEIKNPLTPMRLSVQSFEQQFDPNDKASAKKSRVFSTLIHQIDTLRPLPLPFPILLKCQQESELLDVG